MRILSHNTFMGVFCLLFTSFTLSHSQVVFAGETGLAQSLHNLKSMRGKTCLDGHFHYSSSKNQRSRKLALKTAQRSWMSFTTFEYGSDWGSFRMAAAKKISCKKNDDGGYGCDISAAPCKRSVKRKRYRKRRVRR